MADTTKTIIAVLGYVISVISPIIGLVYGGALFFLKRDDAYLNKHSRFIIVFAILMFVIYFVAFKILGIS